MPRGEQTVRREREQAPGEREHEADEGCAAQRDEATDRRVGLAEGELEPGEAAVGRAGAQALRDDPDEGEREGPHPAGAAQPAVEGSSEADEERLEGGEREPRKRPDVDPRPAERGHEEGQPEEDAGEKASAGSQTGRGPREQCHRERGGDPDVEGREGEAEQPAAAEGDDEPQQQLATVTTHEVTVRRGARARPSAPHGRAWTAARRAVR